ncbi:MAG TPA: ThuA domain-containing protein [Chloroflexota bacterium]
MTAERKLALFAWGGWEGHEPKQTVDRLVPVLEAEGYVVQVRPGFDIFLDVELMQSADLIVPVHSVDAMTDAQEHGLAEAVAHGAGLAAWHGAATLHENATYQLLLGGQFVAHPGGIIDYDVAISRPDDPITAGIGDFQVHSEQYHMHVDPSNEVLATTTFSAEHIPWIAGTVMPVVWKRRWGRGKVFYSSLGHVAADFDLPVIREITRRGMIWATRSG